MGKAAYGQRWCYICGKDVSSSGAAWASHQRKHVRAGLAIERPRSFANDGSREFIPKLTTKIILPLPHISLEVE